MEAEAVFEMDDNFEELAKIIVVGVGGGGGNAVNNMIDSGLQGVEFVDAYSDRGKAHARTRRRCTS